MAKFTQGEWEVQYCGQGLTNIILNGNGDDVIAIVDNSSDTHSPYDADLIAAAPALYEALKGYIEYQKKYGGVVPSLAKGIEALAKAEGKA